MDSTREVRLGIFRSAVLLSHLRTAKTVSKSVRKPPEPILPNIAEFGEVTELERNAHVIIQSRRKKRSKAERKSSNQRRFNGEIRSLVKSLTDPSDT